MKEELSLALVAILGVGTVAMVALLSCYVCVFRTLCCQPPPESKHRRSSNFHEELQMADTTQNVEISVATATETTDPSRN